jgi:hypothetical protein
MVCQHYVGVLVLVLVDVTRDRLLSMGRLAYSKSPLPVRAR